MALKQADRVRETSTTTGTGAMALAGAPSGYRTFSSVLSDGDTCTYAIALDADWEVGVGTYNSSGNTLTRTTVTASSNAGAAVNWGAGSKSVFISPLASAPAFSEVLRVPAGSVSSAAVQGNDDPNTGITFPAPDTIAIVEGGVEALRINSSGEVIVGNGDAVASPSSRTLRGTDGSGSNVAAGDFTIRPGIATGNAASGALIVQTGPAGASGSTLQTATERLRVRADGVVIVGNGDAVASPAAAVVRGADATGSNVAASNMTLRPGLATGNAASGALIVQTGPAGASGSASQTATERLRVNAAGEIIIGNGDAVANPAASTLRATDSSGTNVAAGSLTIQGGRATGNAAGGYVRVMTSPAGSSGSTLQTAAEVARFTADGRLGVGQTAPATKFDLSGAYAQNIVAVAALDIDCSAGNYFTKTINGNSTFTVSNIPASRCYSFTMELTHTSGTVTWFSGVEWPGGAAPSLSTGKTHLFVFVTDDGGTRWRAASLANYTS